MDVKELETFVAVAEYLHFGAAGDHLGLAQPQVSRRVSALEQELKAPLFERNNRAVKLTEFGRAFLPEAVAFIKKAEETRQRAAELVRGRHGVLTASLIDAATLDCAPKVLKEFHRLYPDGHIAFRNWGANSAAHVLNVSENGVDIVFAHPPLRMPENLDCVRLVNDPLVAVVPLEHRLVGSELIGLEQLAEDDWVMFPRANNPPVYDNMIALCRSAGFTPRVVFETHHMLTRLGLIASGYGVHLVHRAWQLMPYPGVAYIPVVPTDNVVVSGFWRKDNDNPVLAKLVEVARCFEV